MVNLPAHQWRRGDQDSAVRDFLCCIPYQELYKSYPLFLLLLLRCSWRIIISSITYLPSQTNYVISAHIKNRPEESTVTFFICKTKENGTSKKAELKQVVGRSISTAVKEDTDERTAFDCNKAKNQGEKVFTTLKLLDVSFGKQIFTNYSEGGSSLGYRNKVSEYVWGSVIDIC